MIPIIGWIVGVLIAIAGIALSYKLDASTTPVIVAGLALFVLLTVKAVRQKEGTEMKS
jgi:ABC-type Mn2+/Zn2+ transport system permease subunit